MLTEQLREIERYFWLRVEIGPGCWIWRGALTRKGYGNAYAGRGRHIRAHRASYLMVYGTEPPEGICVLHTCDTPGCVRPSHLWLGTQLENIADRESKGRGRSGIRQLEKTHCPQGHPYDEKNTYKPKKQRYCLTCMRARDAIKVARIKEERAARRAAREAQSAD